MAKREYQASIQSFRRALESLEQVIDDESCSSLQSWRLTTMPMPPNHGGNSRLQDSCAVFDRCFLIMPLPCHEKVPTRDKCALFTAALMYNLALAYQLWNASLDHAKSAIDLYNKAAHLLIRGLDTTSDGAALMLAVSNNLATSALESLDLYMFGAYRQSMGSYLRLTAKTGTFHSSFFAHNYSATHDVYMRPAPAA